MLTSSLNIFSSEYQILFSSLLHLLLHVSIRTSIEKSFVTVRFYPSSYPGVRIQFRKYIMKSFVIVVLVYNQVNESKNIYTGGPKNRRESCRVIPGASSGGFLEGHWRSSEDTAEKQRKRSSSHGPTNVQRRRRTRFKVDGKWKVHWQQRDAVS